MEVFPHILKLIVCIAWILGQSSGISIEEELTLNQKELNALNQVDHLLPHDYMHENIYLIKWLRAKDFDVQAAKAMLITNLRWREENNMDHILEEDFSHWEKKFPFWLDGRDKEERPVATADIGVWDPRAAILAGKTDELYRYALSGLENGSKIVRDEQKSGRNISQFTLIANLKGFSVAQHACVQCIPFYVKYLIQSEAFFPGMLHKLFLINTPSSFDVLLRIARPIISKQTKEALSIHGTNKKQWMKEILELIEPNQIRPQFGGTKQDFESY